MSPPRRSKPTGGTRQPHRPPRLTRKGALLRIFFPGPIFRSHPVTATTAHDSRRSRPGSRSSTRRGPRRPSPGTASFTNAVRARGCGRGGCGARRGRLRLGASVALAALPGPAVLIVLVARLEEVQAGLADEDPRPIGLDSNAEECRALCLAVVAGLLTDAFGLPDVRSTPGWTLSGAMASQPCEVRAPRLLATDRPAAIAARESGSPSPRTARLAAVLREPRHGYPCLEHHPTNYWSSPSRGLSSSGRSVSPRR